MIDFMFQNPTKIYFGKNALNSLHDEAAASAHRRDRLAPLGLRQDGDSNAVDRSEPAHTVYAWLRLPRLQLRKLRDRQSYALR